MVGDIISQRWARSSRNGGRHHPGMVGGFLPESAPMPFGSEIVGIAEATVKTRMFYARKELADFVAAA
jgi:hypothetical protein